ALEAILEGRDIAAVPLAPGVDRPASGERPAASNGDGLNAELRVTAEGLNRLLGLAGESLIESRWIKPFAESLLRLKRIHSDSGKSLRHMRETLPASELEHVHADLLAAERGHLECQQLLTERLREIQMFDRRSSNLSHRLYDETLACRMRPF